MKNPASPNFLNKNLVFITLSGWTLTWNIHKFVFDDNIKAIRGWLWPDWFVLLSDSFLQLLSETLNHICQVLHPHLNPDENISADSHECGLWMLSVLSSGKRRSTSPGCPLVPHRPYGLAWPSRWCAGPWTTWGSRSSYNHWRQGPLDTRLTDGAAALLPWTTAAAVCVFRLRGTIRVMMCQGWLNMMVAAHLLLSLGQP